MAETSGSVLSGIQDFSFGFLPHLTWLGKSVLYPSQIIDSTSSVVTKTPSTCLLSLVVTQGQSPSDPHLSHTGDSSLVLQECQVCFPAWAFVLDVTWGA